MWPLGSGVCVWIRALGCLLVSMLGSQRPMRVWHPGMGWDLLYSYDESAHAASLMETILLPAP